MLNAAAQNWAHLVHNVSMLLTGVTGLIGGEVWRTLRDAGAEGVTAMVRAHDGEDVRERLADRLRRSGCESNGDQSRWRVVRGDVRQEGWGLSSEAAGQIRSEVNVIIHAASETSFIHDKKCEETNVQGMKHLIDFARSWPRPPLIVYFSTAANSGAFDHKCLREEDGCQPDRPHHNQYTWSKAQAEQMLKESGLPFLVLRPSIVFSPGLPDPAFARAMLWFVPLLTKFDCVPIDPASRLDCVPVSYVTDMTLALLDSTERRHDCYHLSAGPRSAVTCGELVSFLDGYYGREKPLQLVPLPQWTPQMHRRFVRSPEQRKIFSMLRPYLPFLNMDVVYDNTRLWEDLGEQALQVPPPKAYLGELLDMIPFEEALAEALNP